MSDKSDIEWCQATWNCCLGCSKVSPGCKGCYAINHVHRMAGNPNKKISTANAGLTIVQNGHPNWTGKVQLIPERLDIPMRKRKPTRYFVNSLSDLFHESLPDEDIDRVTATMACAWWHTYLILTKRSERLPQYFGERNTHLAMTRCFHNFQDYATPVGPWPLPNVHLGVSVESRAYLHRIEDLRKTPAAVRFLSLEPLLEDLGDISKYLRSTDETSLECSGCDWRGDEEDAKRVETEDWYFLCPECNEICAHTPIDELGPGIDWVIVGGESGPGARPMHPDWARSIRGQCIAAKVPFFFKQWGEWGVHQPVAGGDLGGDVRRGTVRIVERDRDPDGHFRRGDVWMKRIPKKQAGRLLDGRTWDEMPVPHA